MIVVKNFKANAEQQEKLLKILCRLLTSGSVSANNDNARCKTNHASNQQLPTASPPSK